MMHASQMSPERKQAAAFHMREEISSTCRTLALKIAENSQQIACDNDELKDDMLGSGVAFVIVMLIDMLGKKYPSMLEDKTSCMENWIDAIARGMMAVSETCDCPQCQAERL